MIRLSRRAGLLAITAALPIVLGVDPSGTSAQGAAPADLRAAVEGTWQLEEWHVDGQVLRPPQADGRWSNRDGVVLFMLHRADSAQSNMGYGIYSMTADTWGYRYLRMQNTTGPLDGPVKIAVSQPPPEMRWFKVSRASGKVILEGANEDRREYEGPFFTLIQKGKIVRKWRRTS